MLLGKIRVYTVAVVLLAFTSQLFAVLDLTCNTNAPPAAPMPLEQHMGMDHSSHSGPNLDLQSDLSGDCCGEKECAMSHCLASTSAIVSLISQLIPPVSGPFAQEYSRSVVVFDLSELFRPPIFH